jgi:Fungal Zn(2)-Cys(6) binuclear cluster domain
MGKLICYDICEILRGPIIFGEFSCGELNNRPEISISRMFRSSAMAHVVSEPALVGTKHVFVRSYQACVPCRKRKVRCDLGDPGNPSDPPCLRCRREHKDCYFQDLRTKKGGSSKHNESAPPTKRMRSETPKDSVAMQPRPSSTSHLDSFGELYSSSRAASTSLGASISPNDSATADRILHKEVHNANEALNLLYEAAAESRSESDAEKPSQNNLTGQFSNKYDSNSMAWRDFWCVKAGWMTDIEARNYIDLSDALCFDG